MLEPDRGMLPPGILRCSQLRSGEMRIETESKPEQKSKVITQTALAFPLSSCLEDIRNNRTTKTWHELAWTFAWKRMYVHEQRSMFTVIYCRRNATPNSRSEMAPKSHWGNKYVARPRLTSRSKGHGKPSLVLLATT